MKKITNPKHQITNNLQIPIANKFSVIRIWVLCIVCSLGFVYWNLGLANAGSVQFSTYYPAPFGMYDRLRLVPRAILAEPCDPGAFYYETGVGLKLCDESNSWSSLDGGVWTQDSVNNYIYPTDTAMNPNLKIGIGTTVPNNTLQVSGLVNFNDAKFSTSIGKSAGAVNTGDYNSFFGYQAGFSNTTGSTNTASGSAALYSNVGGGRNTASGTVALYSNTTGSTNTASGAAALYSNVGGDRNTASGVNALFSNTAGTGNTAMGTVALLLNTTGNNNIAIGDGAGDNITTGSRNIVIGADIDAPSATTDNQLSIGNLIFGTGLDGTGTTISTGNVGIGTTTPTGKLTISNAANTADLVIGNPDFARTRIDFFNTGPTPGAMIQSEAQGFPDADLQFWTDGDGLGLTQKMLIDYNGNVGIGTATPEFRLTLDKGATTPDGGILAIGTSNLGATLATSGGGTRLIWYPRKAAFRAGYVNGTQWDDANIGKYSVAMGAITEASGDSSTAIGNGAIASGAYSVALGGLMVSGEGATGVSSIAMGRGGLASGNYAVALGDDATASGDQSISMGHFVTASAIYSMIIGNGFDGTNNLVNNTVNSFMVGFMNSASDTAPELFVKDGAVGIGTTTPQSTLQVNGYIQLGSTAVVPPGADCDDAAEEGRMEFNPWTDLLYICSGASGWVTK